MAFKWDKGVNKGTIRPLGRSVADAGAHRISVVINVYNQAHFLGEALDSVMAQSHKADEIIVIDDGSSDAPQTVTDRYPGVRVVRQSNHSAQRCLAANDERSTTEFSS